MAQLQPSNNPSVLALDVGEKRIGLAIAGLQSLLPRPLKTLSNDERFWVLLQDVIDAEVVSEVVVGLPRSLDGRDTQQTQATREFIAELKQQIELPVFEQDEAGTSVKAKEELRTTKGTFEKSEVDALAATYILEDYLRTRSSDA